MKRTIVLLFALLFAISNLQLCNASVSYYDPYYDINSPYVYQQQPVFVPVAVPSNQQPIIINNHPTATASSSGSGIPTQKIIKWGAILAGAAYLYYKFGSPILNFVSSIPQKLSDAVNYVNEVNNPDSSEQTENSSFLGNVFSTIQGYAYNLINCGAALYTFIKINWNTPGKSYDYSSISNYFV